MMGLLMVFIGGGLGSICRYGLSIYFNASPGEIPIGTLIANVFSSIILGFLVAYSIKIEPGTMVKLLLMVGFCGGFSTFSTFSKEAYDLLQLGQQVMALGYVVGSCLLGILSIFIGYKMGMRFL